MRLPALPELAPGLLFKFRKDPKAGLFRIVWSGNQSMHTFFLPISGKEWPQDCMTDAMKSRFSQNYKEGDALEFVTQDEDPYAACREDASAVALERMDWIKDLVTPPDRLFDILVASRRGLLIKEHAIKVGKSRTTLSFQIRRYLARGMTANALEGDTYRCGGPGKSRNAQKKVGPKRTEKAGVGTQVNDSNRSILEVAACFYLAKKGRTFQQALDEINRTLCRDWEVSARFTVRQLQHYIWSTRPFTQRKRKKYGERAFNLRMRPFVGTSDTYGPGAQYQIDATIADVYLVSEFNRLDIVGRPTIYIVSDTFSRLMVGVSVSFAPPSIHGAALAMESVITPKVALCSEYGIEIQEEQWPSHHLSAQLLADRGAEFTSIRAWERVVRRLVVDVANTAAFRPDWKGIVESRFNLVKAIWGDFVPGFVDKDFKERGGTDYRLDATLTLREFTRVFLTSVIEYNNRPLRTKKQIPEMVAEKISPAPVELWNYGIRRHSGALRTVHLNEMRACVYPRDTANVSHLGIGFASRFYETPRALKEEWFAKARDENFKTEVAYDPVNPSKLYVVHKDGTFECAALRKTGPQYDHIVSLSEIMKLAKAQSKNLNDGFDASEPLKLSLQDLANETIANARRERDAAMQAAGVRKLDTEGIRDSKVNERAAQEAIRGGNMEYFDSPVPSLDTGDAAPDLELDDDLGDVSMAMLKEAKKARTASNQ